jgi:hypothetical protein
MAPFWCHAYRLSGESHKCLDERVEFPLEFVHRHSHDVKGHSEDSRDSSKGL